MNFTIPLPLPETYDASTPEIPVEHTPLCPTCRGADRVPFARGHDYELETCRNEWHFWRCTTCGTVWLDPRPAVSALSTIYPPDYYAYELSTTVSPLALKGKALLDRVKFRGILSRIAVEPTSFLDVGCGDGRYLRLFADRGIPKERIYGLELSDEPVDKLLADGFNAYKRRVEDCTEIPLSSIDLITIFHVIEHIADPRAVLLRISDWLSLDGVIAIETPNLDSLDAMIFKDHWWGGYHIPRHWTLFHRDSLVRLCREADLEVLHLAYQTGHSFWMYSLHHWIKYQWRRPKLAAHFDPRKGIGALAAFTGFDIARRMLGAPTSSMLVIARKAHKSKLGSKN